LTKPGIPNDFTLSTSCFGARLRSIEDQAFAAVAMGFRDIELGLSDAPPTLNGFEDTRRETGMKVSSMVAGCLKPRTQRMASSMLASSDEDEREMALNSVRRHIQVSRTLGAEVVILRSNSVADQKLQAGERALNNRLEEDGLTDSLTEDIQSYVRLVQKKGQRQIEHLCRSLHSLMTEFPGTKLAVEPGLTIDDLLSFDSMGWVLDDLAKYGLCYWHDVGRVHRRASYGLPSQGDWLDRYASRMVGVHLQDAAEGAIEMPPGQGTVDFKLLAEYMPEGAAKVLEINPRHGRTEILTSVRFLLDLGF
jgi:sugar phosphate isomerase/epimerase